MKLIFTEPKYHTPFREEQEFDNFVDLLKAAERKINEDWGLDHGSEKDRGLTTFQQLKSVENFGRTQTAYTVITVQL